LTLKGFDTILKKELNFRRRPGFNGTVKKFMKSAERMKAEPEPGEGHTGRGL
jgi:hypothetical protein